MAKSKKRIITNEQRTSIQNFMNMAYKDYLASRTLLLTDQLLPATFFANTAIEKYLKAMIIGAGDTVKKGHDLTVNSIKNIIKNKYKDVFNARHFSFFAFLSKCYIVRYIEDVEDDFEIVISRNKTLAELDFIVNKIETSFSLVTSDGGSIFLNTFKSDAEKKNLLLFNHNYVLQGLERTAFIENQSDTLLALKHFSTNDNWNEFYKVVTGVTKDRDVFGEQEDRFRLYYSNESDLDIKEASEEGTGSN